MPFTSYQGRFAPSPTGPLHFGSLVAAVGSYLDAKHHNGTWLVRMENLDTPRCVHGAADDILRTLEACGLHWDGEVIYQNRRSAAYEEALQRMRDIGAVYPCCCTRREIADSALHGIDGQIYPGTCRKGVPVGREGRAWRVRTDTLPSVRAETNANGTTSHSARLPNVSQAAGYVAPLLSFDKLRANGSRIEFADALQGHISQHLESKIGDFVVKRADGLFAYQLAVVVDDAFQGVTHVVRGADLLASTPRQIWLQRLLGLPNPAYLHLPIAVNREGEKLSKQTLAAPVDTRHPTATLWRTLDFLRQNPPAELSKYDLPTLWRWAVENWNAGKLKGITTLPI